MPVIGIKVVKGAGGYYVEQDDKYPLHVTPALEGIEIKFDTTVPMIVEDITGRKLAVAFTDKINSVVDPAFPAVEVTEFVVDQESMFWFVTAGVPEKEI